MKELKEIPCYERYRIIITALTITISSCIIIKCSVFFTISDHECLIMIPTLHIPLAYFRATSMMLSCTIQDVLSCALQCHQVTQTGHCATLEWEM